MIQAVSMGRWGRKPGESGVRDCLALQPCGLEMARGEMLPGLKTRMQRSRGQHGPLGTKAPKRRGPACVQRSGRSALWL